MGARGILSLLYPGSDIFATKEILLGDDIHERISYQCRQPHQLLCFFFQLTVQLVQRPLLIGLRQCGPMGLLPGHLP